MKDQQDDQISKQFPLLIDLYINELASSICCFFPVALRDSHDSRLKLLSPNADILYKSLGSDDIQSASAASAVQAVWIANRIMKRKSSSCCVTQYVWNSVHTSQKHRTLCIWTLRR